VPIISKDYTKTKHTGLKVNKDGITFLFDIRVDGKRYRQVWESNPAHTKADRLKTAYSMLEQLKMEIEHQQSITADTDATINTYWETLKDIKKTKWSKDQMYKNEKYYDKYILNTIGTKRIRDVKPSMLTQFNKTISHLAPRTQKIAYELLIPIFNLAVEDEIIDRSPIKKTHIPKRNQLEEKKIITDAVSKYRAVYAAINKVYADNPHHRALFLFGFHGRRKNEVLNLRWENIDFDNDTYTIRAETSKVNMDMTFKLPADVKSALLHFKDKRGRVFEVKNGVQRYHQVRDECGIQEFSFHWMRNLAVSALAAMGVEVTHLSSMLGHTDGGTIKKYLSLQREASTEVTNEASKRILS
jgi:integrase